MTHIPWVLAAGAIGFFENERHPRQSPGDNHHIGLSHERRERLAAG